MSTSGLSVIKLTLEELPEGGFYASSPDVPLFHVISEDEDDLLPKAMAILKETLERRLGKEVELMVPKTFASIFGARNVEATAPIIEPYPKLPEYLIAEVS